jgi:hypothetical protein
MCMYVEKKFLAPLILSVYVNIIIIWQVSSGLQQELDEVKEAVIGNMSSLLYQDSTSSGQKYTSNTDCDKYSSVNSDKHKVRSTLRLSKQLIPNGAGIHIYIHVCVCIYECIVCIY